MGALLEYKPLKFIYIYIARTCFYSDRYITKKLSVCNVIRNPDC